MSAVTSSHQVDKRAGQWRRRDPDSVAHGRPTVMMHYRDEAERDAGESRDRGSRRERKRRGINAQAAIYGAELDKRSARSLHVAVRSRRVKSTEEENNPVRKEKGLNCTARRSGTRR